MIKDCLHERHFSKHLSHGAPYGRWTGGMVWMSDLARNSAPLCLHSIGKPSSTARVFRTSLRKNTRWSTRECCKVAQRESKHNHLEFHRDSSSPIEI